MFPHGTPKHAHMYSTSIVLPSKFKTISETKNSGVYEIEGLAPGYGHTLGNSLRRIILSSIPGTGITSFKIHGAAHEFATLPGVREDVLNIVLNLKRARFHVIGDEPQTITLVATKPGIVTAGEFVTGVNAEVLSPDQPIAEITDKSGRLEIDITLAKGLGLITRENLIKEKTEVGHIVMDAVFTPIVKAFYEVENMRVGDRTDYNRLRMILETDGSQTPSEVLSQSIRIMLEQFKSILDLKEFVIPEVRTVSEIGSVSSTDDSADSADNGDDSKVDLTDVLKTRIDSIQLSTRTLNALSEAGIRTVGGLIQKTEKDLLDLDGFGDKALKELKEVLNDFGLALKK
jgi:DNA-directed RNA polymerase subunit alpha